MMQVAIELSEDDFRPTTYAHQIWFESELKAFSGGYSNHKRPTIESPGASASEEPLGRQNKRTGRGHRKGFHFDARHGLLTAYQKRDQIRGTSKAEKAACLRPILANILFDALRRRAEKAGCGPRTVA